MRDNRRSQRQDDLNLLRVCTGNMHLPCDFPSISSTEECQEKNCMIMYLERALYKEESFLLPFDYGHW